MDERGNQRDLYLLVGEIRGKLDQIALQLNSYFEILTKQITEANSRMDEIQKTLQSHQSDIDKLKTRDKIYRAIITFIASAIVLIMVDLLHSMGL